MKALFKLSKKDPKVKRLVEQLSESGSSSDEGKKPKGRKRRKFTRDKRSTPKSRKGGYQMLTSPSDTTIYAPAVKKKGGDGSRGKNLPPGDTVALTLQNLRLVNENPNVSDRGRSIAGGEASESASEQSDRPLDREEHVRQVAEDRILNAEKNKAAVNAPPKGIVPLSKPNNIADDDDDDEFFNLTCHVDEKLVKTIEEGDYVDLEALMPKCVWHRTNEEPRMDLVSHESGVRASFWVPAHTPKENKITNVRKWEEAFRVYAAIYCKANPHRATEVWQYVNLITKAAGIFIWENVAQYDYAFRKLMARKPHRSWARTHTQLYATIMHEHVPKTNNTNNGAGGSKKGDWRDFCCWRYNKGKCTRNAGNCKFEHRCTSCGGYGHGAHACHKRRNKGDSNAQKPAESRVTGGDHKNDKKKDKNVPPPEN